MRSFLLGGLALLSALAVLAAAEPPANAPTVFLDVIVEDAHGRPVVDLVPADVVITQDATRQKVATFTPSKAAAGGYELSYVPASGKAAAVSVRLLRPGARVRGADGPALRPRVVAPLSALETELAGILEERPAADDFRAQASVLRFERDPRGLHCTLAAEVSLSALAPPERGGQFAARVQLFARLKDASGRVIERFSLDRALSAASPAQVASQRFIWTAQVHLAPGRYVLEMLARDAATARASARKVPFTVAEPLPGLRMSSVALLLPADTLVVRDRGQEDDDPFFLNGTPLMPVLELHTVAAPGAKVDFFAAVYPNAAAAEPATMRLDLIRDGVIAGSVPIALPSPDERGQIRYAGAVPIGTFRATEYTLRLRTQQGDDVVFEDAAFTVGEGASAAAPIRIGDGPSSRPPSSARPRETEPPDLARARRLVNDHRYEPAIAILKKLDDQLGGRRLDVRFLLALAYNREGAFKDAEVVARSVLESAGDDPVMRADTYVLLGRIASDSEKATIRKDSERLLAAEALYRKALKESDGQSETGTLALSEVLYRLDRAADAKGLLSELIAKGGLSDPGAARARQLLQSPRCAAEPCLPQFSFVSPEGWHQGTEDVRGKVVLLSFWATWCGPCVKAVPALKQLYASYQKEPFVMIGVNLDHDPEVMRAFVKEHDIGWPQVTEEIDRISRIVGNYGIPAEVLFDHDGVFLSRSVGWGSDTKGTLAARIHEAIGKAKKAQARAAAVFPGLD